MFQKCWQVEFCVFRTWNFSIEMRAELLRETKETVIYKMIEILPNVFENILTCFFRLFGQFPAKLFWKKQQKD